MLQVSAHNTGILDKVQNICVMFFFLFQRLDLDSGEKQYFVVIFYGGHT